jgi:MinD-like ATPase involved in chromosome partitioning or flagellar assembly
MPNVISIHSFTQGTGKTQVAANLAVLIAGKGYRVGVVEANVQAPGMEYLFDLNEPQYYLNDYLLGRCSIQDAIQDCGHVVENGVLFVAAANARFIDTVQLTGTNFPMELLQQGVETFQKLYNLDLVLVDAPSGIDERTLYMIGTATAIGFVMLLDQREYQGVATAIEVARKLESARIAMLVNDVSPTFSEDQVKSEIEHTYKCPAFILPHADELLAMAGKGVFVLQYPLHPLTAAFRRAATSLIP